MCRLLGYFGLPIQLDYLFCKPEHSLIVQSYQPREMTSGVVNADGYGIGWYHHQKDTQPFTYKNILPIWSDLNLPQLSRYIESRCMLANVRSATPGQATDLSNCQPFSYDRLLFVHNGFIQNFRTSLYRPIRNRLSDTAYQLIKGSTDSEHIFALFINNLQAASNTSLEKALQQTLVTLHELATQHQVKASATIMISDGHQVISCRFSTHPPSPTLYWLRDDPQFSESLIIASEPLFIGDWTSCPENSIFSVGGNFEYRIYPIF